MTQPHANPLADIADYADELTNPRRHTERIHDHDQHRNRRLRRVWTVTLPSLLDELAGAVVPGEAYTESAGGSHREFESKPAARLDAVDRLRAIETAAAAWCRRSRVAPRPTVVGNIRALVGAAPQLDPDDRAQLVGDLRAWRLWAATVTGWERPPDAPRAPCPLCAVRNALRVRLREETACCLACGGAWDGTNIGLLAQHVADHLAASKAKAKAARALAVQERRAREGTYPGIA